MAKRFIKKVSCFCVLVMLFLCGSDIVAHAEEMANTTSPSIFYFASKEQLVDSRYFSLYTAEGRSQTIFFGLNDQKWNIAGAENHGSDLVLLSSTGVGNRAWYGGIGENKIYDGIADWGDYSTNLVAGDEVYPNHYGASLIREYLVNYINTNNFTIAEQNVMKPTVLYHEDAINGVYRTNDIMYLPYGNWNSDYAIVGSNTSSNISSGIKVGLYSLRSSIGDWLRNPSDLYSDQAASVVDKEIKSRIVKEQGTIHPAFNLDTEKLLFASAVVEEITGTLNGVKTHTLLDGEMKLRFDGAGKVFSRATFDDKGLHVVKGGENEYLFILYQENEIDKAIVEKITDDMKLYKDCLKLDSFSNCKIWIEKEDADDNMIYAVMADEGNSGITDHDFEESDDLNHICKRCKVIARHSFANGNCIDKCECGVINSAGNHNYRELNQSEHECELCGNVDNHIWGLDGTCSSCGLLQIIDSGKCSSKISWILYGDGKLVISGNGPMMDYVSGGCPWNKYSQKIKTAVIEDGIETIGAGSFKFIKTLTNVTVEGNITKIGEEAFYGAGISNADFLTDGITEIGIGAFWCCDNLKSVVIPDSVTSIGKRAFQGCGSLESIVLSKNITVIPEQAFYSCRRLVSINIPNGVTSIGNNALDLIAAKRIMIPNSVKFVGSKFVGSNDLEMLIFMNPDTSFGFEALDYSCINTVIYGFKGSTAENYAAGGQNTYQRFSFVEIDMDFLFDVVSHNVIEPTCASEGYDEYVTTEGTFILNHQEKVNHSYSGKIASATYIKSEANCSQKAEYYYSCIWCKRKGTELFEYGEVNPNKHRFGTDNICERCSICGEFATKGEHKFGEWLIDLEGNHYKVCIVCGEQTEHEQHLFVVIDGKHVCEICDFNEVHIFDENMTCQVCHHAYDPQEDYMAEQLWLTDVYNFIYTGAKVEQPSMKVYWKNTLLVEGVDYSVKYVNNIKAGTATVVITGKGNYSGTIKKDYIIKPFDISGATPFDSDVTILENGKLQKPVTTFTVFNNGKNVTLKNNVDYKYTYPEINVAGDYEVTITGYGNYTGTNSFNVHVIKSGIPVSSFTIKKIPNQTYIGNTIVPKIDVVYNKKPLVEGIDYTVFVEDGTNIEIGTGVITIVGKGKYVGQKNIAFNIVGTPISKATVTGLGNYTYTGSAIIPEEYKLFINASKSIDRIELRKNIDYVVVVDKNINAGVATITFTGINGYSGSIKKSFKIDKAKLSDEERITVEPIAPVEYQKNGVKPLLVVKDNSKLLKEGTDYTVKYTYNTDIHDLSNEVKRPTAVITGKGNYVGSAKPIYFSIVSSSLEKVDISATDIVALNKANICKPIIKLIDTNGAALKAGVDYDTIVEYYYSKDTVVKQMVGKIATEIYHPAGTRVEPEDIILPDTIIRAKVSGKGFYKNSSKNVEFRFVGANIAKAKVVIPNIIYTKREVSLDDNKIQVSMVINKKNEILVLGKDFEIIGYKNNINKGTAKVIIRGLGNYGGTKEVAFKIVAKTMNYSISFERNDDSAIGVMKTISIPAGTKLPANTFKNTGKKFKCWCTKPKESDLFAQTYSNQEVFVKRGILSFGDDFTLYAIWE